jgi:putative transposase
LASGRGRRPGFRPAELRCKHGISDATFYNCKSKYGGLEFSEAKRLRALEVENAKLTWLLADAILDNTAFNLNPAVAGGLPAPRCCFSNQDDDIRPAIGLAAAAVFALEDTFVTLD